MFFTNAIFLTDKKLLYLLQSSSVDDAKVSEEGQVSELRAVTFDDQCTSNLSHWLKHWELFNASNWCTVWITEYQNITTVEMLLK